MPRILYALLSSGGIRGGHKMTVRHVEGLRSLGFDAYLYLTREESRPTWLDHSAPILLGGAIRPDDVMVLSEDAHAGLAQMAGRLEQTVVFYQGGHTVTQFAAIDALQTSQPLAIIGVGARQCADIARLFPGSTVAFVPCFVDGRIFGPNANKGNKIALNPTKRPVAAADIATLFARLHPRHRGINWTEIANLSEVQTALALAGSSVFLNLGRFESVGLMPLEAMASECICVGFVGIGGWEFATTDNGIWVPDDDHIAAADALAQAADLVAGGGPALRAMKDAGRHTAAEWSYEVFIAALEAAWMQIAPQARVLAVSRT